MLISVIIPFYNREWSLSRAVDSVLGQSWSDLELLLVDDGSTDRSCEVGLSYNDKRIRYFYQHHKGVSCARNLGLKHCRGDYVALLDSDDWWLPEKLTRQVGFMRETGMKISQTEEIWVRNGQRVNPAVKHAKPAGWIFGPSLELCLVSPSCALFEYGIIREIGCFREDLPACEDYEFWLRVGARYPVGLLPSSLVVKTGGHRDQLSNSIIGLDLYRVYALLGLLPGNLLPDQRKKLVRTLRRKAEIYAAGCLKRDKPEEARRVMEMVRRI